MPKKRRSKTARQGSILIIVTWILGLLAVFTFAMQRQVSQELFMGKMVRERTVARSTAKAGVERAIYEVQADEFRTFDALNEAWASNEVAFKDVKMGEAVLAVSCNEIFDQPDDDQESMIQNEYLYGACDESARLNINIASEEQIKFLLNEVLGELSNRESSTIAESLLDWRDNDDAMRPFGAEKPYYSAFKGRPLPRNAPFQTVEELRMVRGVTLEIYEKLHPYVTVYTNGLINFNTVSDVVMKALGIPEGLAQKVVLYRMGEDVLIGTEDDKFFQVVEGITPALSAEMSLSSEEFSYIANLVSAQQISVKSNGFRIRSNGRFIKGGTVFDYRIEAVIKRGGEILYWREEVA